MSEIDVDVDGAYEWLIVIGGIIMGILSSYPDIFWGDTPEVTSELQAVRSVVLPLFVSAMLWLIGKLLLNPNRMLLVKLLAWTYSVATTTAFFVNYLNGVHFLVIKNEQTQAILAYSILFLFSPIFVYGMVYPLYRRKYPDASFFKSKSWFLLVLVLFAVLMFGLIHLSANVAKTPLG